MMPPDDPFHAEGADAPGQLPEGVRQPPLLLFAAGGLALAVLLLLLVGSMIDRGSQFAFDRALLLAARGGSAHGPPAGPFWMKQAAIDITALGGATVLVLATVVTIGFLAVRRLWLTLWLVLGGTVTGSIAVGLAKLLVGRPRPELTDHLVTVSSASFPSGHAANSAIIYLTLATLIVQIVEGRRARAYIRGAVVLLVVMIGCTRVYLGVHWPSDVLAGWAFGVLWALAWWALGAWIRLKRAGRSLLHPAA